MEKVYILGGAQTDFVRNWTKEGKGVVALLKEAISDALLESNISFSDIKSLNKHNRVACFVGNFIAEQYLSQGHLGALLTEVSPAFYGVPSARYEAACASGSVAIDAAMSKIQCDEYDVAIVIGWELMKTVDSKKGGDILGRAGFYEKECKGIDYPFPKLFGNLADEFINRYALSETQYLEDLAMIAAQNHANAKYNPLAQTRNWFMSYEQAKMRGTQTNPYVGGRLAASDCSQVTDGAAVVILVSSRMLKELGKDSAPIIKGYGHRVAPMLLEKKFIEARNTEYVLPWTRQTVIDAYRRSGLSVQDIDVFETHDCFSSSEYAAISAFGLTPPGAEYTAIRNGQIFRGGATPVNPSGGLIGCGHPVGASGVRMFLDCFKQVKGTAGGYQVANAKNALMLNLGGSATTNYVFIVGREDA